jgi:hypothetical protein
VESGEGVHSKNPTKRGLKEREREGNRHVASQKQQVRERDAPHSFGVTTESTRYQVFETGLRVGHSGGRQCVRNQGNSLNASRTRL